MARFKRLGDLPEVPLEVVMKANCVGIDPKQLKKMLNQMRLRAGVESDPGPSIWGNGFYTGPIRFCRKRVLYDPMGILLWKRQCRTWRNFRTRLDLQRAGIEPNPGPADPCVNEGKYVMVERVKSKGHITSVCGVCGVKFERTEQVDGTWYGWHPY